MLAAARYGEVVALLKTRLGGLYSPSWYRALCESPTDAAVLQQLQNGGIPLMPDGRLPTKSWLLAQWLVPDYRSVMMRIPRSARPVMRAWLDRLELENVKYAVRSLTSGQSIRLEALLDLGPLASIPLRLFRDLAHMSDLESAARHTVFEAPLRATAHRLKEEQGTFIVEAALDRAVYSSLVRTAQRYGGPGADSLRRLTARVLAVIGLLWIIRYRFFYGLATEAILGLTAISTGPLSAIVHRAMTITTLEDFPTLWTVLREQTGAIPREPAPSTEPQTLAEGERELWRIVHRTASALLLGSPFAMSVIVGLLLLKELAIRDIALICQGRTFKLSADALAPLLIHR